MKTKLFLILAIIPVLLFAETPPWKTGEFCTRSNIRDYLISQPSVLVPDTGNEGQVYDNSEYRSRGETFIVKYDYSGEKYNNAIIVAWGRISGNDMTLYIPINLKGQYLSYKSRSDIKNHLINIKILMEYDGYQGDWVVKN
jgi:hypothetical protein